MEEALVEDVPGAGVEPLCAAAVLRAVPEHPAREALAAIARVADPAGA